MPRRSLLVLALFGILVATHPAASKQGAAAPTNLYIDVATHTLVGMPELGPMIGGLGKLLARHMGGAKGNHPSYPTTPHPGMRGRYLDIALHNTHKPGVPAQDQIPTGLNLGEQLNLLPIELDREHPSTPSHGGESTGKANVPDMEIRISEYWGCGAHVRPGQPKVASFKIKGGSFDMQQGMRGMQGMNFETAGSLSKNLSVPDRAIGLHPGYVYWPNPQDGQRVPDDASLVGQHQIRGDGIPASMQFQVAQSADFMPTLMLRSSGEPADAISLSWPALAQSRAYFISAMKMKTAGQHAMHMVIWSSAEVAGAGSALHTYLSNDKTQQWLKQKVLLAPSTTSCTIPQGIFAADSGESSMVPAMLIMTAYGPETWITYPPKPANPKLPWQPEWSVRLRAKSTATGMLGMRFGGPEHMPNDDHDDERQQQPEPKRPSMGRLLKGILGG